MPGVRPPSSGVWSGVGRWDSALDGGGDRARPDGGG